MVFCNAFATETLPIFLDRLTSPLAAVALSMSVVLLFGEVIPQAVCSRYGLAVGARAAWLVKVLMVVCFPVAAPLAWVLDRTLGGGGHPGAVSGSGNNGSSPTPLPHSALFRRAQLKALVDVHAGNKERWREKGKEMAELERKRERKRVEKPERKRKKKSDSRTPPRNKTHTKKTIPKEDEGLGGNLTVDEVAVIRGALDLSTKTAACCLTPIERVFALPTDARLDGETLRSIVASGHSRVPVHSPGDKEAIVGVILVKELLLVDRDFDEEGEEGEQGEGGRRNARRRREPPLVAELKLRTLPHLRADTKLYDMLRLFETGRCHMAVLVTPPRPLGEEVDDDDDGEEDDEEEEEEEEEERRRRRRRNGTRDFSDDASFSDDVAPPPPPPPPPPPSSSSPKLSSRPSSALPVPSFPSSQSRSALAEVLCARGDRLTPPTSSFSAAAATATTAATAANGNGSKGGTTPEEIQPAAAAPDRQPSPSSSPSSSSSSSVEDSLGGRVLGIVTIEDVLEELIGHAILDETDRFEDRAGERRVNARALAASLPSHLRELLREHSIRVGGGGGGGGGGAAGERGAAASGYGVGLHFHSHGNGLGGGFRGGGAFVGGGSRLLPPAARQAVIGDISGSPSSPLAAAVAARRMSARGSVDGAGSPSSSSSSSLLLLRQPLLSAGTTTAAGATTTRPPSASAGAPSPPRRPWT